MTGDSKDAGILAALVERLEKIRLPRALALKDKVDRGELLDEWDIGYLEDIFEDADAVLPLVDKHPDYQALYARVVHLYKEITAQGLKNAQGDGGETGLESPSGDS